MTANTDRTPYTDASLNQAPFDQLLRDSDIQVLDQADTQNGSTQHALVAVGREVA